MIMAQLSGTFGIAVLCGLMLATGCSDATNTNKRTDNDTSKNDAEADAGEKPEQDPLYLIGANIQTTSESVLYLWASPKLDGAKLELEQATELTGASDAITFEGHVYVPNSDESTITRYLIEQGELVEDKAVSFVGRGFKWISYAHTILSAERAFLINSDTFKIVEWNPTTMTITKEHDISALERSGWGNEFRNGFVRSDGKLIFHWTYTNDRKDFVNSLLVAVWDANSGELTFEEDTSCPTSAGFGGYFDEDEDLYLIADSFGLFTQFGGFEDPKPACIVRIRKGETTLDPTFKQHPSDALGGRFPWGFYYVGDGLAFTSAIDPETPKKFDSVFETLFAPEHEGWLLDVKANTARKISGLPKDGVGFESHRTEGRLFVPRTSGMVTIENIMSTESTLYEIKPDASAEPVFSLPGYINPLTRVR
jgi:hypothetical protein